MWRQRYQRLCFDKFRATTDWKARTLKKLRRVLAVATALNQRTAIEMWRGTVQVVAKCERRNLQADFELLEHKYIHTKFSAMLH